MAKYNITLEERTIAYYEIDANSYEEARRLFDQGEGTLMGPRRSLDSQIVEARKVGDG